MFTKRVYADFAAATPLRKEVEDAMRPYWRSSFGNASAIHAEGLAAKRGIEAARSQIAQLLHVRSEGVTFTGSGTESNNLALIGVVEGLHQTGRAYADMEIVAAPIEHPSILETLEHLRARGVRITHLPIGEDGRIDVAAAAAAFSPQTVLLTCAYVNSEIGVIQPLQGLSRAMKAFAEKNGTSILFHTDAAQAPLWLPCALDQLGVDLLSLDAGKCYGPKGIGILARRHGIALAPILFGGPQEGGMRASTENVPLIIGAEVALRIAQERYKERAAKTIQVRDELIRRLCEIPGAVLNGSASERVANNVNISIEGMDGEYAVVVLDSRGIAASTRSACSGAAGSGSTVVRAISGSEDRASSTLRFTLGESTTHSDIARIARELHAHVLHMRQAFPAPVTDV